MTRSDTPSSKRPTRGPLNVHVAAARAPAVEQAVSILRRVLLERAGTELAECAPATADLVLDVHGGVGTQGFAIEPSGRATLIRGNDPVGLLHGIGQYLHTGRFAPDGFKAGGWRGVSVPEAPVRAMYCAFNFSNWYCTVSREEVARYAEELALWGYNTFFFNPGMPDPADRAAFEANREGNRRLFSLLKRAGLSVGILSCPNCSFPNPPQEALAVDVPDTDPPRRGNACVRVCPSHPAGREYLHRMLGIYLDGYEDIGVDYVAAFPYDAGGCACERCWPWGSRGFVELSKDFSQLARDRYPSARFVLCTWCYDVRETSDGEFEGLDRELRRNHDWVQYIMADSHEDFPRYPLDVGVPGGLPLLNFPEISMWGRYPWGGYGANPMPARFQRLWDQVKHLSAGGFPYSEGIFEDINKVLYARFYWDRDASAVDTLRDYIAYEYAPEVTDAVAEAVRLMEESYPRSSWKREDVEKAYGLIMDADRRLPERARTAWRWRILYLRAVIDHELITRLGEPPSDRCDEAFEELTRIYHAEKTGGPDSPPSRRCLARLAAESAAAAPPPPGADEK